MVTVENVSLGITESPGKPGHSLITYSYELHPGESDWAAKREFTVTAGLWGQDMFDDDVLATDMDQHKVSCGQTSPRAPIRVERVFEVATALLHEDLIGGDEVFLIVEADAGAAPGLAGEHRASGKSNIVKGDF